MKTYRIEISRSAINVLYLNASDRKEAGMLAEKVLEGDYIQYMDDYTMYGEREVDDVSEELTATPEELANAVVNTEEALKALNEGHTLPYPHHHSHGACVTHI